MESSNMNQIRIAEELTKVAGILIAAADDKAFHDILSHFGTITKTKSQDSGGSEEEVWYVVIKKPTDYEVKTEKKTWKLESIGFTVPIYSNGFDPKYIRPSDMKPSFLVEGGTTAFSLTENFFKSSIERYKADFQPSLNDWTKLLKATNKARSEAYKALTTEFTAPEGKQAVKFVDGLPDHHVFWKPHAKIEFSFTRKPPKYDIGLPKTESDGKPTRVHRVLNEVYADVDKAALKRDIVKDRLDKNLSKYFSLVLTYDNGEVQQLLSDDGSLLWQFDTNGAERFDDLNTEWVEGEKAYRQSFKEIQKAYAQVKEWHNGVVKFLKKDEEENG